MNSLSYLLQKGLEIKKEFIMTSWKFIQEMCSFIPGTQSHNWHRPKKWIDAVPFLIFFHLSMVQQNDAGIPNPPFNLTITEILATSATLQWHCDTEDYVLNFLLNVNRYEDSRGTPMQQYFKKIDGNIRAIRIRDLIPATEYETIIIAKNSEGSSNESDVLVFRTLSEIEDISYIRVKLQPVEITIVALILIGWVFAVILFLHKWEKIRVLQPAEPRYRHNPKNLDTIKVVKKHTDGIIFKSYSKSLKETMIARQKKTFARMHSMPTFKSFKRHATIKKQKTVPVIEMEDLSKLGAASSS